MNVLSHALRVVPGFRPALPTVKFRAAEATPPDSKSLGPIYSIPETDFPQMGLKPMALADWIQMDDQYGVEMALKRQLATDVPQSVFASLPGSEAGSREALEMLVDHLTTTAPQNFQRQGDRLINRQTNEIWNLADPTLHPLQIAGRLVQEDLCLMQKDKDGKYVLTAGSLSFPSRWRLSEKLNQSVAAIHGPVPKYGEKVEAPIDGFFERMKVEKPMKRQNWSIHDTDVLYQPETPPVDPNLPPITEENAGERLWFRAEGQTLRRLPQSKDILFTIRTTLHPLSALKQHPALAKKILGLVQKFPPEVVAYKGMGRFMQPLLRFLEKCAQPANPAPVTE